MLPNVENSLYGISCNVWWLDQDLYFVKHPTHDFSKDYYTIAQKSPQKQQNTKICPKIPSFFLTFDLKYVQFQTVVSSSSIFVQHQGLFEAWNPLITFFGGLTAEISGCARSCVRDLKPGVLTNNRGVHRLDGNVLGVQLKTLNETLENKENHLEIEILKSHLATMHHSKYLSFWINISLIASPSGPTKVVRI